MSLRVIALLSFSLICGPLVAAEKPAAAKKEAAPQAAAKKPVAAKPKPAKLDLAAIPAVPWPPELPGIKNYTVTFSSPELLTVPEFVKTEAEKPEAAPFEVAKNPPTIDLAFHTDLGPEASKRRTWSSWGDICLASDGSVYCALGDHGNDLGGDARCFIYRWDPTKKTLTQVVDMNKLVPPKAGRPSWSKVHAKIDEGRDGKIYFCCTLNDGNKAGLPNVGWDEEVPGGQIYQYDPATGKSITYANLPAKRCTATSKYDKQHDIWWCNLEAGEGQAMWGLELSTKKEFFRSADGSVGFNRAFAVLNDGSILFNGPDRLLKIDYASRKIVPTGTSFGKSPGMRCATAETREGLIYGVTYVDTKLFSYDVKSDELTLLGPSFLTGGYTTIAELSPDEKYVYYLPGAHGQAFSVGTPIIRFERATGKRTVLAFLGPYCEKTFGYVPGGTYGMKVSADGKTLYVNFNGHATEQYSPANIRTKGFGLNSFAAIHLADE
jgi:hypothetical protein